MVNTVTVSVDIIGMSAVSCKDAGTSACTSSGGGEEEATARALPAPEQ